MKSQWLQESLDRLPAGRLRDVIAGYLRAKLPRCHSKSQSRFSQWLRLQTSTIEFRAALTEAFDEFAPPETGDVIGAMWALPKTTKKHPTKFKYAINGDVALIPLSNAAGEHAIWLLPVDLIDWASSQYPVFLKRLPALEPPEVKRLRLLKNKFSRKRLFEDVFERQLWIRMIADQEEIVERARQRTPIPRFEIMKSVNGRDVPLHRLLMNALESQTVEATDGNFLNYVDNLSLTSSLPSVYHQYRNQSDFENSFLQIKMTAAGDIAGSLPIKPNWDLGKRTGVGGGFVKEDGTFEPFINDCGKSERFSEADIESGLKDFGSFAVTATPQSAVDTLSKAWGVPTSGGHQRRF